MTGPFSGKLQRIDDHRWKIPSSYMEGMRVDGMIFANTGLIRDVLSDNAPQQVANAACLPGITKASLAMPDIHWGYGLPIGGVVATDIASGGVITPGGVGYDINCGVRLLRTDLSGKEIEPRVKRLVDTLFERVPVGVGSTGKIKLDKHARKDILVKGAKWAVDEGYGWQGDLLCSEENGCMSGAEPAAVSERAFKRGYDQPGTLGSGNHFLEVQVVDEIYAPETAEVFGIKEGQVTVMIHTGSRGFGHQVCGDYAAGMVKTLKKFGINVPDRQLACAPVTSEEGASYIGAMKCAANYAWANRQVITHLVRETFTEVFGETPVSLGMTLVYDVAHNIAKIERHNVDGRERELCVHRKGATRALGPGHPDIPPRYMPVGQPVIIPGDMGRYSYLLAGTAAAEETFYSTCHGAGRRMSRSAAKNVTRGRSIERELADKGILVRFAGHDTIREEAPEAYKDVKDVVDIVNGAGISRKVARMKPLCVVKG